MTPPPFWLCSWASLASECALAHFLACLGLAAVLLAVAQIVHASRGRR